MGQKSGLPPISVGEIEGLLASSAPTIQRHAAVIALSEDWVLSGVFTKSLGYEGILTAGHCATTFLGEGRFALCVSEERHQLWVEAEAVEHVPVGFDETEGPTLNGPDLSFVIIRDESLCNIIRSRGLEFYDLDRQPIREVFGNPFAKFNVSGKAAAFYAACRRLVSWRDDERF